MDEIAKVAHEVNRAYCEAIGDNSQPAWESAPDWQKTSAVNGVKHHLERPNETPRGSHEAWMAEKVATGWKFGPVKDVEKKEHPCIVPFEWLKESDKAKDFVFRAVVRSLQPYLDGEET